MSSQQVDYHQIINDMTDWRGRRQVALDLGWEKPDDAYDLLIQLLKDYVLDVRQSAVVALGRLGNPRAVRELNIPKILHSRQPIMRQAAVVAIGHLGNHEILPVLAPLINDEDWVVRTRVEEIIVGKLNQLSGRVEIQTIQMLIRMLDIDHKRLRKLLIETIGRFGNVAIDKILAALENGSPRVQTGLIEVLGNIGYRSFATVLLDYLENGTQYHKVASARALGKIRSEMAIDGLVRALDTFSRKLTRIVSGALIEIGEESVSALMDALKHTNKKHYRVNLIAVLGEIGDIQALDMLVEELANSYSISRSTAVTALKKFPASEVLPRMVDLLSIPDIPVETVFPDVEELDNPRKRARAIRVLGDMGNHRAVPVLKKAIKACENRGQCKEVENALCKIACHSWSRAGAIEVLKDTGEPIAFEVILEKTDDDSHYVRNHAVQALREFREERMIQPLINIMLGDPKYFVRASAVNTLGRLWDNKEEILHASIRLAGYDKNHKVRGEALKVLARYIDSRSIDVLIQCLSDVRWSVRENAELALRNFGPEIISTLNPLLETADDVVRLRVARILGRVGDETSLEVLRKEIGAEHNQDERIKVQYARAIRKIQERLADHKRSS